LQRIIYGILMKSSMKNPINRGIILLAWVCCLMACDNEALRESLYVYTEDNTPVAMYTQANDSSPIVAMIPSGEALYNVSWAYDGWMYGKYDEVVRVKKKETTIEHTGYVRRGNIRRYSSFKPLPEKDKDLSGWRRKMDDYSIVRAKEPVPVMQNMQEHEDEFGVVTYTYDTVGWLAPQTWVRPNLSHAIANPDYKHGEYFLSVNAPDSLNGFMYGYHLKKQNISLISRIFWWAYYSDPAKVSKIDLWKDRKFAKWKRQCWNTVYDESRSVWDRYHWHFWGLLLWLILSLTLSRFTYITAFFLDVVVPWVYISVMPEYFWFASPWIVKWWCILGFPFFVGLFYIFWRRLVSHFMKIWVTIGNMRFILCIYYIIYTLGMAIVCINLFVGALSQDVGLLIVAFIFCMIPASSSGAGDADRGEIIDTYGNIIRGRFSGLKFYGDDGNTYQKDTARGTYYKI